MAVGPNRKDSKMASLKKRLADNALYHQNHTSGRAPDFELLRDCSTYRSLPSISRVKKCWQYCLLAV